MKYIRFSIYSFVILSSLLIYSCARAIMIPNLLTDKPAYTMFGRIPERSFYIDGNFSDSLKLKWQEDVNGGFANTSVSVYDDYVFAPDLSGRVYGFKISDGKRIGYMSYKGAVAPAPVLNKFKLIYAVSEQKGNGSEIYFFDIKTGDEIKVVEVKGKVQAELIKTSAGIIAVAENGEVYCYDFSANKKWDYVSEEFVHSSPALSGSSVVFGNDKGEIISINSETGRLNYRKKIGNGFEGGFTSKGNTIFTADKNGILYAIESSSGNILWKYNCENRITATPVLDSNFIYVGNLNGKVFKISQDGKKQWEIMTGGVINITPLLFNNTLVQPDFNKKIYLINTDSGSIKKTLVFDDRVKLSPVYMNGIIFFGTDNGKLYAYEVVE